jgi:hypothetical protein
MALNLRHCAASASKIIAADVFVMEPMQIGNTSSASKPRALARGLKLDLEFAGKQWPFQVPWSCRYRHGRRSDHCRQRHDKATAAKMIPQLAPVD